MDCKGLAAVGRGEVLKAARVPKGSFYHYFESKEAFGAALLKDFFEEHLAQQNAMLTQSGKTAVNCLLGYGDH